MPKAVGVMNGNWRYGIYNDYGIPDFTSPRDDVINELKELMGADWSAFYDDLYNKYRWNDTKKYEKVLRDMLRLYKEVE